MTPLDPALYRDLVRRAIAEDLGAGDITTEAIVPADGAGPRRAARQEPVRARRPRRRA